MAKIAPSAAEKLPLDRGDVSVLKGIAILSIVLHNYFHHTKIAVQENEFTFKASRVVDFLAAARDPSLSVQALFAYLGHFGVQIFLFLSAYGLAIGYWKTPTNDFTFLRSRIKKIYPTFFLAIATWFLLDSLRRYLNLETPAANLVLLKMATTTLGIINLVPGLFLPPVGPWWFLPCIMQFYLAWPLFSRAIRATGPKGLVAVGVLGMVLVAFVKEYLHWTWGINLLQSPLGHLPEFCLGVAAARYRFYPKLPVAILALGVFGLANVDDRFWTLAFASALLFMLWAYKAIRPRVAGSRVLKYLGERSMPIFFVNGFTRTWFFTHSPELPPWYTQISLGVMAVLFPLLLAELFHRIEMKLPLGGPDGGAYK